MKNAKRILEKFDSWKYDIYESNKSDWTKQDDKDVNEIEKLLKATSCLGSCKIDRGQRELDVAGESQASSNKRASKQK